MCHKPHGMNYEQVDIVTKPMLTLTSFTIAPRYNKVESDTEIPSLYPILIISVRIGIGEKNYDWVYAMEVQM